MTKNKYGQLCWRKQNFFDGPSISLFRDEQGWWEIRSGPTKWDGGVRRHTSAVALGIIASRPDCERATCPQCDRTRPGRHADTAVCSDCLRGMEREEWVRSELTWVEFKKRKDFVDVA